MTYIKLRQTQTQVIESQADIEYICKLRTFNLIQGMYCPLIDKSVTNQQYAKERHPECPLYKPDNNKGE